MRVDAAGIRGCLFGVLVLALGCGGGDGVAFTHPSQSVVVSTLAGETAFNGPMGVAVDGSGTAYVANTGDHTIKAIAADGTVSLVAGISGSRGSEDGPATTARFNGPTGVAVDGDGNVYVADSGNSTIRKITSPGVVSTLAGTAGHTGSADGTGPAASFWWPFGLVLDATGTLYVSDAINHTIRKVTATGVVTTLAGSANRPGSADGKGSAATFSSPRALALDGAGNLYVVASTSSTIRKVTPDGTVTTLAGRSYSQGCLDNWNASAKFFFPCGIAGDGQGNLFVADTINETIRQIWPSGGVSTLAGTTWTLGYQDGAGSSARFFHPAGVAVDPDGNLIVADTLNNSIRKVTFGTVRSASSTTARPTKLAAGTGRKVLSCLAQAQQHSEWCGVTSCSCVLTYLGNPKSQCEIVNYMEDINYACTSTAPWEWNDPIANIYIPVCMGPKPSETDVLFHYGFPSTGRYSALTYAQIQEEIDAGRPFIILWDPAEDLDVHLLVGIGYDNSSGQQDVVVMNPGLHLSGIIQLSYESLCANAYNGTNWPPYSNWNRTITIDPF
jgi:sugar lactone lactonase YvrE